MVLLACAQQLHAWVYEILYHPSQRGCHTGWNIQNLPQPLFHDLTETNTYISRSSTIACMDSLSWLRTSNMKRFIQSNTSTNMTSPSRHCHLIKKWYIHIVMFKYRVWQVAAVVDRKSQLQSVARSYRVWQGCSCKFAGLKSRDCGRVIERLRLIHLWRYD